jgi:hypothetical protein
LNAVFDDYDGDSALRKVKSPVCDHKLCIGCWNNIYKYDGRCPFCRVDIPEEAWLIEPFNFQPFPTFVIQNNIRQRVVSRCGNCRHLGRNRRRFSSPGLKASGLQAKTSS